MHFISIQKPYNNYYPYGMEMQGRRYTATSSFRFGFNNKENDAEVEGQGNSYDYGDRIYDSRIGRWLCIDPLAFKYPSISPYVFCANNSILLIDPDGREVFMPELKDNETARNEFTNLLSTYFQGKVEVTYTPQTRAGLGVQTTRAKLVAWCALSETGLQPEFIKYIRYICIPCLKDILYGIKTKLIL